MQKTPETPMKSTAVLHVVDSLERGGLERLVNDLAIAQHRAGGRVGVFSINRTGGYLDELQAAGVPVIVGNKQGTLDRRVLGLLRRTVEDMSIEVVHAHNFVPSYHAAVALLGLRLRPAQVVTCHDMGTRLSNRRLRWLFKLSILRTQGVAMVGQQVCQRFIRDGFVPADKAVTLLNAVPVEHFGITEPRRQSARQQLGLPADALVVGCVGRLVELKNHAALIRLWPKVLASQPQARLVLIGDGPLRDELQALARSLGVEASVVFAGLRSNVSELLAGLDVFALPSLTEGVSIALLEAGASGLPSLASRVGGNVEVVEHGRSGWLFDIGDEAGLLDGLLQLTGSASLRDQLGQGAQSWVRQHASLDVLRRHYESLYAQARGRL